MLLEGVEWIRAEGKDLVGYCPRCHAPKLYYHKYKHVAVCNSCHEGFSWERLLDLGFFGDVLTDLSGVSRKKAILAKKKELERITPTVEAKPQPIPILAPIFDQENPPVGGWDLPLAKLAFQLRGWDLSEPWVHTCQYCPSSQRLYFRLQSKDPDAETRWTSRSVWPSVRGWMLTGPRAGYWYGILPPTSEPLILMESINDVIGTHLYGHAIAMLGTSLGSGLQAYFHQLGYRTIKIWLDPDVAGETGAIKLHKSLRGIFPQVDILRSKDDPKKVSRKEAWELCGLL